MKFTGPLQGDFLENWLYQLKVEVERCPTPYVLDDLHRLIDYTDKNIREHMQASKTVRPIYLYRVRRDALKLFEHFGYFDDDFFPPGA